MHNRMLAIAMAVLCVSAGVAMAQYNLYFLTNGEFESSLQDWYTAMPNNGPTPGQAEWSPEHDGSAHLTASGFSTVQLFDCLGTTLYPGDTLYMRVTQTAVPSPGNVALRLGAGYQAAPFSQFVATPREAGEHEVALVCNRFYPPGTALLVILANWSGSSEAWVHYLRLARAGGVVGIADEMRHGAVPALPLQAVSARPTLSRASVSFGFDLMAASPVQVAVYDAAGCLVREMRRDGALGQNTVTWDGRDQESGDLPAGSYFYSITTAAGAVGNGKVVLTD
jgi:hypothetical protein